jgi:hypothetical protein
MKISGMIKEWQETNQNKLTPIPALNGTF